MYILESQAPRFTPAADPTLHPALVTTPLTRITFSGVREIACTCQLPKLAPNPLTSLIPARTTVLTCNSLFDEELDSVIALVRPTTGKIKLEVHLATAALERGLKRIATLPADVGLIIIIDKMDPSRISVLEPYDLQIAEYRIIPSKTYPVESFLRELPAFVQRKLTWSFLPGTMDASPFLGVDDLHWSLAQVTRWPLSQLTLSQTQAYSSLNIKVTPVSANTVWVSSNVLTEDQRRYLQKTSDFVGKNEIYAYPNKTTRQLSAQIQKYRFQSDQAFHFLDNSLMSLELWNSFVQSPFFELFDHFSWNEFLQTHQTDVTLQRALESCEDTSAPASMSEFIEQCRRRYARHPESTFYSDFFSFFEPQLALRKWSLRGMQKVSQLSTQPTYRPVVEFFNRLSEEIENWRFEVRETQHILKKLALRSVDLYWLAYKFMWKVVDVGWMFYQWGWKVADFFWLVYKHVISPVTGFVRTLAETPEKDWSYQPWHKRFLLRGKHIAKKFGWLVLKALKLR